MSPERVVIYRKIVVKIVGKSRKFAQLSAHPVVGSSKMRPIDLKDNVPKGEEKVLLFYPVPTDVT